MRYRKAQYTLGNCEKNHTKYIVHVSVSQRCCETDPTGVEFELRIRNPQKKSKIEGQILSELAKRRIQVGTLEMIAN